MGTASLHHGSGPRPPTPEPTSLPGHRPTSLPDHRCDPRARRLSPPGPPRPVHDQGAGRATTTLACRARTHPPGTAPRIRTRRHPQPDPQAVGPAPAQSGHRGGRRGRGDHRRRHRLRRVPQSPDHSDQGGQPGGGAALGSRERRPRGVHLSLRPEAAERGVRPVLAGRHRREQRRGDDPAPRSEQEDRRHLVDPPGPLRPQRACRRGQQDRRLPGRRGPSSS